MSINRLAALASSITVIGAVLVGLYFSGSPAEQRLLRIDERRVQDLIGISQAKNGYWERFDRLPENLQILVDGQRMRSFPSDPETGASYIFQSLDDYSYRLCVEFSVSTTALNANDFWAHEADFHCFEFEFDPVT